MEKPRYKAVPRIDKKDKCKGCAGYISDEACDEVSENTLDLPSCVGSDGVIYVEVKDEA